MPFMPDIPMSPAAKRRAKLPSRVGRACRLCPTFRCLRCQNVGQNCPAYVCGAGIDANIKHNNNISRVGRTRGHKGMPFMPDIPMSPAAKRRAKLPDLRLWDLIVLPASDNFCHKLTAKVSGSRGFYRQAVNLAWPWLCQRCFFLQGDFTNIIKNKALLLLLVLCQKVFPKFCNIGTANALPVSDVCSNPH